MGKHSAPENGQSTSERNGGPTDASWKGGRHRAQETTPLTDRGNDHASHGSTDTASQPNIGG